MRRRIEVVEVGPRDGLQNESVLMSTADKVSLIRRAIGAGARRIEVASFVNPKRVPQMADAEAVVELLGAPKGVTRIGLVLNERGAERALASGLDQLGAVAIASDSFGIRNQGQDSAQSIEVAKRIITLARGAELTAQVTIAVAFGCPFEGEVAEQRVVEMAIALAEAGPVEIGLADTIGVGNPAHVASLVGKVRLAVPTVPVRVHFHNTRGTGLANVWSAILAGAVTVDAAIGGLGGCPFAPGAAGNVSTEDVVYMLERAGVRSGLDLSQLVSANHWLCEVMQRPLPGMVAKAPPFPKQS